MLHFYRKENSNSFLINKLKSKYSFINDVSFEYCFNVELKKDSSFTFEEKEKLIWLFAETFEPELTTESTTLPSIGLDKSFIVEVGPRLAFTTAWR
jgi:hypothetical protein